MLSLLEWRLGVTEDDFFRVEVQSLYQFEFISTQSKVVEVTQMMRDLSNTLQELHVRLTSLATHSTAECDPISLERPSTTALRHGIRKLKSQARTDDSQEPSYQLASDAVDKHETSHTFVCHDDDCENGEMKFTRKQDLERHWGLFHYDTTEFCNYCKTVFTRPAKYMQHTCVKTGPESQRKYTKSRCAILRDMVRADLAVNNVRKRVGDTLCRDSDKRRKASDMNERSVKTMTPLHDKTQSDLPAFATWTDASLQSEPGSHISASSDVNNGNTNMQHQPIQAPLYINYANTSHQQGQSISSHQSYLDSTASANVPTSIQLQSAPYQAVYAPIYSTTQPSRPHPLYEHNADFHVDWGTGLGRWK
ncbi:hypothetical protein PGQ11_002829 [Apiospora arundinis]|uniref:C2H2-type domain-containing protein n=1 Tax=Apiospora arundinis TaxID=335852 RepID=A0ABR2J379_9PEZI